MRDGESEEEGGGEERTACSELMGRTVKITGSRRASRSGGAATEEEDSWALRAGRDKTAESRAER